MTVVDYILILALGQGYILAFFLLISKYYKSRANVWLAVTAVLISTIGILDIVGKSYVSEFNQINFILDDLELDFLVYVPLYFYFQVSLLDAKPKNSSIFTLCLPFLIDTLINVFIVSFYSNQEIAVNSAIVTFYEIETVASLIFNLFLCYKAYQFINGKADKASATYKWLLKICRSTLVVIAVWILISIALLNSTGEEVILVPILYAIVSLWFFWVIYTGVVNLNLISSRKEINLKLQNDSIINAVSHGKPVGASVKQQTAKTESSTGKFNEHFERISTLVQSEFLYRNEDLSIGDISERIGMSPGYVSQIIKNATQQNFPAWINEFRVSEVIEMFSNEEFENYTSLSIGLEAGFKSKSAFYATFSKITGETPAKYRQKKS